MDVSALLQASASKSKSIEVEKDVPVEIDAALLTATDPNPVEEEYNNDLESYLLNTARDNTQLLVSALFALPVQPSQDGPLAQLPPPTTVLPRAKPLPKAKPPTKWERFAAAKGIQKKRKEKKEWDEEKGEFKDRWGRKGKAKELDDQWLVEVPTNADPDFDPLKDARKAKKERVAKNEASRMKNIVRGQRQADSAPTPAQERDARKAELERGLVTTRISTASMGKFDKKFEGEPKLRGVKRKFEPAERSVESEKASALAILSKLDSSVSSKRAKKSSADHAGGDDVLNVRKAIRYENRKSGGRLLAGRDSKPRRGGKK